MAADLWPLITASVNDGINPDMCSLHYISVQDAIDEVRIPPSDINQLTDCTL